MLAFIPTIVVLLFSANVASAFSPTAQQITCLQTCGNNLIPSSGCSAQDFACLCGSSDFTSKMTQCFTGTCGLSSSDAQAALNCQNGSTPPPDGGSSGSTPSTGGSGGTDSGKKNSAGASGIRGEGVVGAVVGLVSYVVLLA
ncbi:hypothetical protein DFH09DRAFT_1067568 [Mycena vulgaris]|nr:hypothetical protein DFH09DRAFT_1067568 [Mycena vulgaris]